MFGSIYPSVLNGEMSQIPLLVISFVVSLCSSVIGRSNSSQQLEGVATSYIYVPRSGTAKIRCQSLFRIAVPDYEPLCDENTKKLAMQIESLRAGNNGT